MTNRNHATKGMALLLGAGLAFLGAGCELIPGLTGGSSGGASIPGSTTAALEVVVVDASGTVAGRQVEPTTTEATGFHNGGELVVDLQLSDGSFVSARLPSQGDNPYGGGPGGGPRGEPGFILPDGGTGETPASQVGAGAQPTLMACADECFDADEARMDDVQGSDGRTLVLDGRWESGDTLHAELWYTAAR